MAPEATSTQSLRDLITWLEEQPSGTEYDFMNVDCCLVARFLAATRPSLDHRHVSYAAACGGPEAYREVAVELPWTYGAALKRARRFLAETSS